MASIRLCQTPGDVWLRLNADKQPVPEQLDSEETFNFSSCLRYFEDSTRLRIIQVPNISQADERFLASEGISQRYLARNLGFTVHRNRFFSRKFQLTAIQERAIHAISPFDGRRLTSNQSFLTSVNVIFYRFAGPRIFYVASAGIGRGFPLCAIYFPLLEVLVTSGEPWTIEEEDVLELKARMVANAALCSAYLSDRGQRGKKVAVVLGYYHFAHHLWNELSGLQKLHHLGLFGKVDRFFVMREPVGRVDRIFPELPCERIERVSGTADLFQGILQERCFATKVGDNYLFQELADRVYKVAREKSLPETIAAVEKAKKDHFPLLWIGVRVGSRTWLNQVDGLSSVIQSLAAEFPKLGVVFDGFSTPADRCAGAISPDYEAIVSIENEVVDAIRERLRRGGSEVGLFNIVGSCLFDANVWAHAIDFYVSPYGSLQHKVGWLASKPGLIHTNRSLLRKPTKQVWIGIEGGIRPHYILSTAVEDVPSLGEAEIAYRQVNDRAEIGAGVSAADRRALVDREFDNYVVEWELLSAQILDLMKAQLAGRNSSSHRLVDWSLKRLARSVQLMIDRLSVRGPG